MNLQAQSQSSESENLKCFFQETGYYLDKYQFSISSFLGSTSSDNFAISWTNKATDSFSFCKGKVFDFQQEKEVGSFDLTHSNLLNKWRNSHPFLFSNSNNDGIMRFAAIWDVKEEEILVGSIFQGTAKVGDFHIGDYRYTYNPHYSAAFINQNSSEFVVFWRNSSGDSDLMQFHSSEDGKKIRTINLQNVTVHSNPILFSYNEGFVLFYCGETYLYGIFFSKDGIQYGSDIEEVVGTSCVRQKPSVAKLITNDIVVFWGKRESYNDILYDVVGGIYNSDYKIKSIKANMYGNSVDPYPSVVALKSGFVVIWNFQVKNQVRIPDDDSDDGYKSVDVVKNGIILQMFDNSGSKIGNNIRMFSNEISSNPISSSFFLKNNSFIVSWIPRGDLNCFIYGKFVNDAKKSSSLLVDVTTLDHFKYFKVFGPSRLFISFPSKIPLLNITLFDMQIYSNQSYEHSISVDIQFGNNINNDEFKYLLYSTHPFSQEKSSFVNGIWRAEALVDDMNLILNELFITIYHPIHHDDCVLKIYVQGEYREILYCYFIRTPFMNIVRGISYIVLIISIFIGCLFFVAMCGLCYVRSVCATRMPWEGKSNSRKKLKIVENDDFNVNLEMLEKGVNSLDLDLEEQCVFSCCRYCKNIIFACFRFVIVFLFWVFFSVILPLCLISISFFIVFLVYDSMIPYEIIDPQITNLYIFENVIVYAIIGVVSEVICSFFISLNSVYYFMRCRKLYDGKFPKFFFRKNLRGWCSCFVYCCVCSVLFSGYAIPLFPITIFIITLIIYFVAFNNLFSESDFSPFKKKWDNKTFLKHLKEIEEGNFELVRSFECECFHYSVGSGNEAGVTKKVTHRSRDDVTVQNVRIKKILVSNKRKALFNSRNCSITKVYFVQNFFTRNDERKIQEMIQIRRGRYERDKKNDSDIAVIDNDWRLQGIRTIIFSQNGKFPKIVDFFLKKVWARIGFVCLHFPLVFLVESVFTNVKVVINVELEYSPEVDLSITKKTPLKEIVQKIAKSEFVDLKDEHDVDEEDC